MADEQQHGSSENVGEMHKRREIMADGKRYLIYYTFGQDAETSKVETKSIAGKIQSGKIQ